MKTFISIALILIFAIYLGGIELMYNVKRDVIKETSATAIKTNKFQSNQTKKFFLNKADYINLTWTERNKEFTYNNVRYDIISISYIGNKIKLTCFKDSEETAFSNVVSNILEKLFSPCQQSKNSENNISNKISKEYLPREYLVFIPTVKHIQCHFASKQDLKPLFSGISIWHPPAIA